MRQFGVTALALALFGGCSGSTASSDARSDAASAGDEGSSVDSSARDGSAVDHSFYDDLALERSTADAAPGTPYVCAASFMVTADGGEIALPDAAAPATCVVGQSYCAAGLPRPGKTGAVVAGCASFPSLERQAPSACAEDPTCACFCDSMRGGLPCCDHVVGGPFCGDQCECIETNGFATIACQAI